MSCGCEPNPCLPNINFDEWNKTLWNFHQRVEKAEKEIADIVAGTGPDPVNADWNATSGLAKILNKPLTFPPSSHTHSSATTSLPGFMPTISSFSDVSGNWPNLSVVKLRGRFVSAAAPSAGMALLWNDLSGQWEPTIQTKAMIGLGNADNTSDADKPISNAVQAALAGKSNTGHTHSSANITDFNAAVDGRITAQKGTANGLATLGANGILSSAQWPAGIDDVVEYATLAAFPATGEQGKIYIAINAGESLSNPTKQYRWSGSSYVLIPSAPGSSDSVPEGTTNLYFTEGRVRSTLLTGFAAAVSRLRLQATDSILGALQKIDKYLADFGGGAFLNVGTVAGTLMAGDDSRVTGAMQKASNLSDLANAGTARTNLGLGALAVKSAVDLSTTDATGIMAAARMPAHTGDVTSSAGTVALSIAANAVTNAKSAQMPSNTIKGNPTGATANQTDMTPAQARSMLNVADGANNYVHPNHSGDVTSTGDGVTVIVAGAISNAKMANMAALTFKANITGAAAAPQDISLTQVRSTLGYARSQELSYSGATATATINVDITNFEETWIDIVFNNTNVVFNFVGAAKNKRVYITATQTASPYSATFSQTVNVPSAISWNTASGKVNTIALVFISSTVAYGNSTKYA